MGCNTMSATNVKHYGLIMIDRVLVLQMLRFYILKKFIIYC